MQTIVALAIFAAAPVAWGQVYKCTDASGKTTYSDARLRCRGEAAQASRRPEAEHATNPHMCAQLLDETRRLDAEADRDAKRGRAEAPSTRQQRQKMAKRYSERCVGITRSGAKPAGPTGL